MRKSAPDIVEVWSALGAQIHQDFLTDHPDLLPGIREIYDLFSSEQRSELHRFLLDVRSRNLSALELARLWNASEAYVFVVVDDAPKFFEVLLSELEAAIRASG